MIDAFKIVAESAQAHSAWAIAILAGTVAAIVGTSHYSPLSSGARSIYLLFIPGWVALGISIYYGDRVFRSYIAAAMARDPPLDAIGQSMNNDYLNQQLAMVVGLAFVVFWLLLYVLWWIVWRPAEPKE